MSTENKKLRAKVEVLKEQVQDLMNDQAEMVRAQKSLKTPKAQALMSHYRENNGGLQCAALHMENERLQGRMRKLETMINYQRKENMLQQQSQ